MKKKKTKKIKKSSKKKVDEKPKLKFVDIDNIPEGYEFGFMNDFTN